MNKILSLIAGAAALCLCACGTTNTTRYYAPSTAPVTQRVQSAGEKITSARSSVTKAQASAKKVKEQAAKIIAAGPKTPEAEALYKPFQTEIDNLTNELVNTQAALLDAQNDLVKAQTVDIPELQQKITNQTVLLNHTSDERDTAVKERDIARKSYHKLKFWIIGVAAAATLFLIYSLFHFAAFTPPILYLTIAAPAAVSTFLLFYL